MPASNAVEPVSRRTRGRPSLEDVARIEEQLLSIALREFLLKGYGGASMSQIVKAAGISKTTLYSRFNSKEALFRAIMHQQVKKLAAATALTTSSGPASLVDGLKNYANHTLQISLEGELLAVNRLINSEAHRFPELGIAANERTELGISQIAQFIDQCALSSGRQCHDARSIAEAFIHMLRGWYVNALLANREIAPRERKQWVDRVVPALIAGHDGW